jgi:glycosyltransferase involved in cell wall biosynthesis
VSLRAQKSIGIFTFTLKTVGQWDPDSVLSGIGGSEEAVIYLSSRLAELGYRVYVFGTPPNHSRFSLPESNPRYVDLQFNDFPFLDAAIAWRRPRMVHQLKKCAKKVFLWPHDILTAEVWQEEINQFDDVLWLTEFQRKQWISQAPGFARFRKIFGNGIEPNQFHEQKERINPYSCIYASNYSRGLDVLLDIWPKVKSAFPKATLDIYYGWQDFAKLNPEKHDRMQAQVSNYADLGVRERGKVGQEELNCAFEKASFWTYPCTFPETFCITALRAQLSGAVPVVTNHAALKETVRHGFKCANPTEYLPLLLKALHDGERICMEERKRMGEFVLHEFTWEKLARKFARKFDRRPIVPM